MPVQRFIGNSDGKDKVQTWRNSNASRNISHLLRIWLICVGLWLGSTKQWGVWKEELKEGVGYRGQNVALESESSRFKSRFKQMKVPKQFTQTPLASVSYILDCPGDRVNVYSVPAEEHRE